MKKQTFKTSSGPIEALLDDGQKVLVGHTLAYDDGNLVYINCYHAHPVFLDEVDRPERGVRLATAIKLSELSPVAQLALTREAALALASNLATHLDKMDEARLAKAKKATTARPKSEESVKSKPKPGRKRKQ